MRSTAWRLALLVAIGSGCQCSPADIYFPQYHDEGAEPVALVAGDPVEADGCIWIDLSDGRALPIWRASAQLIREGGALKVRQAGYEAVVGSQITRGGGVYQGDARSGVRYQSGR